MRNVLFMAMTEFREVLFFDNVLYKSLENLHLNAKDGKKKNEIRYDQACTMISIR